jgi:hypothetical protein
VQPDAINSIEKQGIGMFSESRVEEGLKSRPHGATLTDQSMRSVPSVSLDPTWKKQSWTFAIWCNQHVSIDRPRVRHLQTALQKFSTPMVSQLLSVMELTGTCNTCPLTYGSQWPLVPGDVADMTCRELLGRIALMFSYAEVTCSDDASVYSEGLIFVRWSSALGAQRTLIAPTISHFRNLVDVENVEIAYRTQQCLVRRFGFQWDWDREASSTRSVSRTSILFLNCLRKPR